MSHYSALSFSDLQSSSNPTPVMETVLEEGPQRQQQRPPSQEREHPTPKKSPSKPKPHSSSSSLPMASTVKQQKIKELIAKRHKKRRVLHNSIEGIRIPAIRRLALRAGVKRSAVSVYNPVKDNLATFLQTVVHDAVLCAEHCKRSTVTANDVLYALQRQNLTMYT